jgi:hypothetical protein
MSGVTSAVGMATATSRTTGIATSTANGARLFSFSGCRSARQGEGEQTETHGRGRHGDGQQPLNACEGTNVDERQPDGQGI